MNSNHTTQKSLCNQTHEVAVDFQELRQNEKRTLWVVLFTTLMMIVEIVAGYVTGSMALLADGYHMASHAGALGIAFVVYRLAQSPRFKEKLNFGTGKILTLGGYTSAIGLGMIALWMAAESIERFLNPTAIHFNEAIVIAVLGLIVNILSALILGLHSHNHDHETHRHSVQDHNHQSALVHVLADALTSVAAIIALIFAKSFGWNWLDPVIGVVGSLVILRWAYSLIHQTAWELLDAHSKGLSLSEIQRAIENDGHIVFDLHVWNSGPSNIVCILTVKPADASENFRKYFKKIAKGVHLVVEKV